MPKIRDLGIHSIPLPSRPPSTETWLAGPNASACGDTSCADATSACGDASCVDDKDRDRDRDRDRGQDTTSDCGHSTCVPDDEISACGDASCSEDRDRDHDRHTMGFSNEAVWQLRQQLEAHLDQQ